MAKVKFDEEESDQAERCPICRKDPFDGGCKHVVTAYDATFPGAMGMGDCPLELDHRCSQDWIDALHNQLLGLLLLLNESSPSTRTTLGKQVEKLHDPLRTLVKRAAAPRRGFRAKQAEDCIDHDAYAALSAYGDYVTKQLADLGCSELNADVGGPCMTSSYCVFFSPKATGAVRAFKKQLAADAKVLLKLQKIADGK